MKETENREDIAELLQMCDGCAWDGHEECVKRPGQRCLMRVHLSAADEAYLRRKEEPAEPVYIDRNQIKFYETDETVGNFEHYSTTVADRKQIMSIPRANVRPVVEGHWIPSGNWNDGTGFYQCSACRQEVFMDEGLPTNNGYLFCPHCGADMRERKSCGTRA